MTYATKQDMIDRFGSQELIELTDRADPPTAAIVDAVLDGALHDADDLIDSYIRARYDLPLAQDSSRLVRLAGDIARYFLHEDGAPERVKDAYDHAIAFLKDVAADRASLDVAEAPPKTETGGARFSAPERVFSREKLEGF